MPPTKYGKFVSREIIAESKYSQITTPIARYNGCRGGGNALSCEWSCINRSFTMDDEPEVDNERDQLLLFVPSNIDDPKDFHAEIEFSLGKEGKKQLINEPACIYVPKGMVHSTIKFKTVKKPIAFLSCFLSPEFSTNWNIADRSKYVAKLGGQVSFMATKPDDPPGIQAIHPPNTPFRYIRQVMGKGLMYMLWSSVLGFPAKVSWSYEAVYYREYAYLEPVHAHRDSHQICMYLGGNPLDIEDFDTKIDLWLGKEREYHVIDTCAVDHMVPGLVHLGDEVRKVGKPFIKVMWVIGPYMNNYYEAAPKDKVLLSDESKGEVMIPKGAHDYVPPTNVENWVWPYPTKKS